MTKKRKIDPWTLSPDYETGYCRPPKSGQIKPGEVRNPRGRSGKRQPAEDLLLKVAGEQIAASVNGKTTRMSQEEAGYRKLFQEMLKGNPSAMRIAMEHLSRRRPPLPPIPTLEEIQQQEAELARREELSAQIIEGLEEMAALRHEDFDWDRYKADRKAGMYDDPHWTADLYGEDGRTGAASPGPLDQPVESPTDKAARASSGPAQT